jgi:hypothetical protein
MGRPILVALYALLMPATIVVVDVLFLRGRGWLWERLIVNIGIALIFVGLYFTFLKHR